MLMPKTRLAVEARTGTTARRVLGIDMLVVFAETVPAIFSKILKFFLLHIDSK